MWLIKNKINSVWEKRVAKKINNFILTEYVNIQIVISSLSDIVELQE